jgi:hypothetical protein
VCILHGDNDDDDDDDEGDESAAVMCPARTRSVVLGWKLSPLGDATSPKNRSQLSG